MQNRIDHLQNFLMVVDLLLHVRPVERRAGLRIQKRDLLLRLGLQELRGVITVVRADLQNRGVRPRYARRSASADKKGKIVESCVCTTSRGAA